MAHGIKALLIISIIAIITFLLRAAPFILFSKRESPPKFVVYLGKILPFSMISMLVVYCLKDVNILTGSHGIPELIALICVAVLHLWKRNTIISITFPTIIYMLLVQFVFV